MNQPLVSVIVTTKNNHETLDACLQSITAQDYQPIELVVVDNYSTDDTADIARRYTPNVHIFGPERSAQRNFAVDKATGTYIVIIDSDMELSPHVISACVRQMQQHPELGGLTIPEESFGKGFWAQCKKLERSFYVGVSWIEAARFYRKDLYQDVGGFDSDMVSGEDWDLSQRISKLAPIGRVDAFIFHNEGRLSLSKTLKKKYYYAGLAGAYMQKHDVTSPLTNQAGPLQRYKLFFSKPGQLFRNPATGLGMLFMKTSEFGFGGMGYLMAKRRKAETETVHE